MSNVNIKRLVDNIKSTTSVYTPIVEVIVNAIQAIEAKNESNGVVSIRIEREKQYDMEKGLPDIVGFSISDNGIGFDESNRQSFDTLYTDHKIKDGGKGFGRFVCLKYFEDFIVDSVFKEDDKLKKCCFSMGKQHDIIFGINFPETDAASTGTKISLNNLKSHFPDKKVSTIAKILVEKLLPYFVTEGYICPNISISESDGSGAILLNGYLNDGSSSAIKEINIDDNVFILKAHDNELRFSVRAFKIYSPKSQKSKISLIAHKREVTDTNISDYIPEFIDEFFDKNENGESISGKNFVIKAYVFGEYLDENVSLERGNFNFQKDNDVIYGISQTEIESEASKIAKSCVVGDIAARQEKKRERVLSYVDTHAPWHKDIVQKIDFESLAFNPSNEDIENKLQKEKYRQERDITVKVNQLLQDDNIDQLNESVSKIVESISETSKNDLVHYVALRKNFLSILEKSLQKNPDGKYSREGVVHDIIFPRKSNSDSTLFSKHNLWIIDERLNFTEYLSSDQPLNTSGSDKPDILAYNRRVVFRGDNEPSNPITIFEFKRPQRDDFVNPSSKEDPIAQIIRYVKAISDGDCQTPHGRKILVTANTPFYGYIVCDLTPKVEDWLKRDKGFKQMPDSLGWFDWNENINLYMEVLSWDKVVRDANMRNKFFFHTLGIE